MPKKQTKKTPKKKGVSKVPKKPRVKKPKALEELEAIEKAEGAEVKEKRVSKAKQRAVDIIRNLTEYEGIMLMSDNAVKDVVTIPSGILSLDLVIGGGYPCGRLIEIFGPPGSGKTTSTLHAIASAQKLGGVCVFIDVEHALDKAYAKALGVDFSTLIFDQPDSGEEALNLIDDLAPMMKPGDLIVVDSVAALTPQAELDGEIGDSHMGLHARLMSQAMRKLNGQVAKSGVLVIFINQMRKKIGVVWGSPETTTGGEALKFYASIRIDIRRTGPVKKGTDVIGNGVKFKAIKNKTYPPYKESETGIRFGRGIPRSIDVLEVAKLVGIVEKSGAWLSFKGERLGHGAEKTAEFLEQQPRLLDELEEKILDIYNLKRTFKRTKT